MAKFSPRDARDAQPPSKLYRKRRKPSTRPLQKLKNPINYGGARIIARGPAATTAAASAEEWTRGATAGATAARRAGSSSPRGRRENVAAAAGCAASATPGLGAATAATNWKRTPGSARRVRGAASRGRPTGTTSAACGQRASSIVSRGPPRPNRRDPGLFLREKTAPTSRTVKPPKRRLRQASYAKARQAGQQSRQRWCFPEPQTRPLILSLALGRSQQPFVVRRAELGGSAWSQ